MKLVGQMGARRVCGLGARWGPLPWGPRCSPFPAHRLVHPELYVALGAEELVGARVGEGAGGAGEQQEVIEEQRLQLLVALGLVQLPTV